MRCLDGPELIFENPRTPSNPLVLVYIEDGSAVRIERFTGRLFVPQARSSGYYLVPRTLWLAYERATREVRGLVGTMRQQRPVDYTRILVV